MFTGIIESVGQVRSIRSSGGQMQLGIDIKHLSEGTCLGDSIAVNGVCLTVSKLEPPISIFDVSTETVRLSTISTLKTGSLVNLERAMSAQGRFGGHIVQGHVDGMGKIASIKKEAQFAEFRFEVNQELLSQIVLKGSVAVDGISLTVSKLDTSGFSVALIPTTLQQTTWQNAKAGDAVNIETDILIKIIQKQLNSILPNKSGLSLGKLAEYGF